MKTRSQRLVIVVALMMILQVVMPLRASYAMTTIASQEAGAFSLPDGKAGQSYEYQMRTEGGLPPLTWKVVGGDLPPGISVDASGKVKGVPTTPRRDAFAFTLEVSDSSQPPQKYAQPLLIVVQAAPLRVVMGPGKLKVVPPDDVVAKEKVGETVSGAVAPTQSQRVPQDDQRPENKLLSPYTGVVRTYDASPVATPVTRRREISPSIHDSNETVKDKKKEETAAHDLDPARFVRIYETPKVRDGKSIEDYGKLIYDPDNPTLNNIKLTADESGTIVIVPIPRGRDMPVNNLYMSAQLASADKSTGLEVTNYTEIGKAPTNLDSAIGVSFETARNLLNRIILLQVRATQILHRAYQLDGEMYPEQFRVIDRSTDATVKKELRQRARQTYLDFRPDIESILTYLVDPKNRNIVTLIANNVFNIDRDALTAISKQFQSDLSFVSDKSNDAATVDDATDRLLERTKLIYDSFRSARIEIRDMTANYANYVAPSGVDRSETEEMVNRLKDLQRRIADSSIDESTRRALTFDAAVIARDIYADDRSGSAIATLRGSFYRGYVSLSKAKAQDGDTLYVTVEAINPEGVGKGVSVPFEIAVKKYGVKLHWASSFMFIKRLNITDADTQPAADGTTLSRVNYAPSPGMSYGFTYFKRGDRGMDKFARVLAPTIGMNVSFMNFKDPGFDLTTTMFTNTKGTDVQIGAGPVFSLFNNKLDFTYGWNLNVERKRNYFGIGFGFIEIAKELTKYLK